MRERAAWGMHSERERELHGTCTERERAAWGMHSERERELHGTCTERERAAWGMTVRERERAAWDMHSSSCDCNAMQACDNSEVNMTKINITNKIL